MSRKPKQPSFGDVDAETRATVGEEAEVLDDVKDLATNIEPFVEPAPDPRTRILWAHFVKPDTRYASQSSSAPAVADDGKMRIYLDEIEGVKGIAIEDPSFPPGFVPMTNVASFVVKR